MDTGFFDMAEHNELLRNTMDEARAIQEKTAVSQRKMAEKEKALLEPWLAEKQAYGSTTDEIKSMIEGWPLPFQSNLQVAKKCIDPAYQSSRHQ